MAELVQNFFEEFEIDFSKYRGQLYENAANMAEKYNAVRLKILENKKFAKFIPCAGHSLNLNAVNFFCVIYEPYCFSLPVQLGGLC